MNHETHELIRAIHQLEQNISDKIHAHTTTLQVNNHKLQNLKEAVDKHREILYGHDDGKELGLISRMHAIEKMDGERKLTLRVVTASFIGLLCKFFWDFFRTV